MPLEAAAPYICSHSPRRARAPPEVDSVTTALLDEGKLGAARVPQAQGAQALVEVALALPLILGLLFGTLALSRIVKAQIGVIAVAHEAARAGAMAFAADDAVTRMKQRTAFVAPGFGLAPQAVLLE
jgi:hypothetical protein